MSCRLGRVRYLAGNQICSVASNYGNLDFLPSRILGHSVKAEPLWLFSPTWLAQDTAGEQIIALHGSATDSLLPHLRRWPASLLGWKAAERYFRREGRGHWRKSCQDEVSAKSLSTFGPKCHRRQSDRSFGPKPSWKPAYLVLAAE